MEPLTILTSFVLVILFGILASIVSERLGISNMLLLILFGIGLAEINRLYGFFALPDLGMVILSIIALVLLIFDGASRFKMKALNDFSVDSLKVTGLFIFFFFFVILPAFLLIFSSELGFSLTGAGFNLVHVLYGCIIAILLASTDPASVFYMLKGRNSKSIDFLEVESIFNTPIIIIFPFLLLDLVEALTGGEFVAWGEYGIAFLNQVVVGLGAGLLVGIIFFKSMKRFYSEEISPLSIITSALLAYILAENLNGSGVLSVAVLGFMFGNIYVAKKDLLKRFNNMLGNSLEILVFTLLGFIVDLNLSFSFYIKALGIFGLLVLTRYLAIFSVLDENFSTGEKWFITLNMTKGIAVAVMVFSLSILPNEPLTLVNNLLVVMIIYSVLTSTVVNMYSKRFISLE